MENKTKIILNRKSQWLNRSQPYTVKIDGEQVGSVYNGASEEFIIEPGKHVLSCSIFWYGSLDYEFEINQNEILYVTVKNGMTYYWPLISILIAGILCNNFFGQYLRFNYPALHMAIKLVYLLPMIYFLYYISIARKKYLVIEEDKNNIFAS